MNFVRNQMCRLAPTQASVMLSGESGSGKELAARAVQAYIPADRLVGLAPLQARARSATRSARRLFNVPIEVGNNLKEAERSLIEATLEHFSGNKTQTAVALGCSLKTLNNKLNGYTRETAYSHS